MSMRATLGEKKIPKKSPRPRVPPPCFRRCQSSTTPPPPPATGGGGITGPRSHAESRAFAFNVKRTSQSTGHTGRRSLIDDFGGRSFRRSSGDDRPNFGRRETAIRSCVPLYRFFISGPRLPSRKTTVGARAPISSADRRAEQMSSADGRTIIAHVSRFYSSSGPIRAGVIISCVRPPPGGCHPVATVAFFFSRRVPPIPSPRVGGQSNVLRRTAARTRRTVFARNQTTYKRFAGTDVRGGGCVC